jgi:hypothetical protein
MAHKMTYYIKNTWGPGGQDGYPADEIHFAEGQQKAAERFSRCEGFFIYETGHCEYGRCGAKAIFTRGIVTYPEVIFNEYATKSGENLGVTDRKFPYSLKIEMDIRVNPLRGVPLNTIRRILGKPQETMQRQGGLIKITEEQFDEISSELEKINT